MVLDSKPQIDSRDQKLAIPNDGSYAIGLPFPKSTPSALRQRWKRADPPLDSRRGRTASNIPDGVDQKYTTHLPIQSDWECCDVQSCGARVETFSYEIAHRIFFCCATKKCRHIGNRKRCCWKRRYRRGFGLSKQDETGIGRCWRGVDLGTILKIWSLLSI